MNKPLHPCRHPGCRALVTGQYCQEHQREKNHRGEDARARHRLYCLPVWTDTLRPQQLMREPFCRECGGRGLRTPATDVDHIVPHNGNRELFLDPDNLQSLCHQCHSRKTLREIMQKKAGSG